MKVDLLVVVDAVAAAGIDELAVAIAMWSKRKRRGRTCRPRAML